MKDLRWVAAVCLGIGLGWLGTAEAAAKTTPTVTVTPGALSITTAQSLTVKVALSGTPAPTGTVTLTSGSYTSSATKLTSGSATIAVPAGALAVGSDTLKATYTPDSASSSAYNTATGTSAAVAVTQAKITPTVTVTPATFSITTAQGLSVTVAVSGGSGHPVPTGNVSVTIGSGTSFSATLASGSATLGIPSGTLAAGSYTLTATYQPDSNSSTLYNTAKGTSSAVTVTQAKTTPKVTVTPSASTVSTASALSVTVAVSGGTGHPTPTGSVVLSSGSYSSSAATLSSGSASISIPAGSLAVGSDTLKAAYTPDSASSSTYNSATGTSSAVTVTGPSTVTVNQSSKGPAVTDRILGMNLVDWYDVVGNAKAVNGAFAQAGIQAIRWPGGSWSDEYHWETPNKSSNPNLPYMCENNSNGVPNGSTGWGGYSTFAQFVTSIVQGGNYDLALTADYGTDPACTGPGDPTEAEAWVAAAVTDGIHVSHVTVGNEQYGSWETDLHAKPNDAATYANATKTGYYPDIKAADPATLVGVSVNPGNSPAWDPIVLANAKGYYDFVEFHYYPEAPGQESDTFLTQQAAQELTANIDTIKAELATAGVPNTPIYVGEIGGPYTNPGKQSWSIAQGLYAGQVLGEMMNDGVSRLTWWDGFGNCNGQAGNDSSSVYGWQDFGAYNVFSDGPSDTGCPGAGPIGTMSPTARAFQLFSSVAVTGESVLTATVSGDTTDVRAYAATHSGGTALVLFNLNENLSLPAVVTLSGQSASTGVTVETYSKAIYDQSQTDVWAPPTTTSLGAQSLPLTLTLAPWSMNVVLIE